MATTTTSNPLTETLIGGTTTQKPCEHCDGGRIKEDGEGHEVCEACQTTPDGTYVYVEMEEASTDDRATYDNSGKYRMYGGFKRPYKTGEYSFEELGDDDLLSLR